MTKLNIPSTKFSMELAAGTLAAAKKAAEAGTENMLLVHPSHVTEIDGFNVRVDTPDYLEHVAALAESIKANGFYANKPLGGYIGKDGEGNDALLLTDGYSRLRALRKLMEEGVEIGKIPFAVKAKGTSLEDLTVALVQDNEGRKLEVYEKAVVVKRLKGYGMAEDEIARRLGMTKRYVDDLLLLAGAPRQIAVFVTTGKVSATEAIKQIRANPTGAAKALADMIKKAEAKGKGRATAKDNASGSTESDDNEAGETNGVVSSSHKVTRGKSVTTLKLKFKQGAIVPADEIKLVSRLQGGEWWNFVDEKTDRENVVIEANFAVEIKITTDEPKDPEAASENEDTAPAPRLGDDSASEDGEDGAETPEEAEEAPEGDEPTADAAEDADEEL